MPSTISEDNQKKIKEVIDEAFCATLEPDNVGYFITRFFGETLYEIIENSLSEHPELKEIKISREDIKTLSVEYVIEEFNTNSQLSFLAVSIIGAFNTVNDDYEVIENRLKKLDEIPSDIPKRFSDMESNLNQEISRLNKELNQNITNLSTTVTGLQGLVQNSETRIVNQVKGDLSQDLQRLATIEATIEERIPKNFTANLERNITNSIDRKFSDKFLNKGLFLTVTGIVIAAFSVASGAATWAIYGRLGTLESNYSTLNGNINTLNGRIDSLQNNNNARFDALQNILLNQETGNNPASPSVSFQKSVSSD